MSFSSFDLSRAADANLKATHLKTLRGAVLLPFLASEDFISQRHEVKPALALNLLKDIQALVIVWQEQLRQIVRAMHKLHAQGPMVDGWLESSLEVASLETTAAATTLLRHGEAEALMQYVEALENPETPCLDFSKRLEEHEKTLKENLADDLEAVPFSAENSSAEEFLSDAPAHQYALCSLNKDGTVLKQLCPSEQMAIVSAAIARHQKFKQLIQQKQAVEAKLQQAVDQLTEIREHLTSLG
ncbi:MAG: hypothetical protein DCF15_10135 [Phormidesmis priestleyi]|uniref:Uncharacterized protein n=1 Tax=Phormidesmis priestleyi TaxID=268141 RepID=A0A2W4XF76_9CYAN|nr:MAG: hypothetical protein DCF15_10135 [Phormidesmis priestleyi]